MLKKVLPVLICCIIFSCSNDENLPSESQEQTESQVEMFKSDLRSDTANFQLGQKYQDTVIFKAFISDYDYWMINVESVETGKIVSLHVDDEVPENLVGTKLVLQWDFQEYYEAGEGDEPYYAEHLIAFEALTSPDYFPTFMEAFINQVVNLEIGTAQFAHNEVNYQTAFNPGLHCSLMELPEGLSDQYKLVKTNFFNELPEGDFCEGYPGATSGFYWDGKDITYTDLPQFSKLKGDDFTLEPVWIAEPLQENTFRKVIVILDEYQMSELYFIEIDNDWFLVLENWCDCSA